MTTNSGLAAVSAAPPMVSDYSDEATSRLASRHSALNFTGERVWLWLTGIWRYPVRAGYRLLGSMQRRVVLKGWWPFVKVLLYVIAFLALAPVVLHYLVSLLQDIGLAKKWGVAPAPDVKSWLTPTTIALLFVLVVFMRWLSRARERVLVEGFIDHTTEDATAVSGLSDMLVTELTRLRELYRHVNVGAIPMAVGVERQGGFRGEGSGAIPERRRGRCHGRARGRCRVRRAA